MKTILAFIASTSLAFAATGDFLFQKKTSTGYEPILVTPANGQVISWSGGAPINLDIAATYQPTLVSGTNIKTINGSSVLGSGNITVASDLTSGPVTSSSGVSAIADAALSIAKTTGLQTELDAKAGDQVTFYDRFDDLSRYSAGALLTHGSLPKFGNAWRMHFQPGNITGGSKVVNGRLQVSRSGGYYLSANVTVVDPTDFSMGVEFVREPTNLTATSNNDFTLALGPPNLVAADGSSINISGNIHINMMETGIRAFSMNFNTASAAASTDFITDIITIPSGHGFETNDYVQLSGTIPTGLSASVSYFVMKIDATTFKLASSRDNVASNTPVDIGSNVAALTLARNAEPLNREYRGAGYNWLPDVAMNSLVPLSGSTIVTGTGLVYLHNTLGHRYVTGDICTLEGANLPGNLQEKTVYYIIYGTADYIRLASTAANAAAGTAITFSSTGSGNMLIRSSRRETTINSVPAGLKSIVTARVKGDVLSIGLAGVGTVDFYYRGLVSKIPQNMSFYWQSPPSTSTSETVNFHSTYAPTAIWVDAPEIEKTHTTRLAGAAQLLVGDNVSMLPSALTIASPRTGGPASTMFSSLTKTRLAVGSTALTSIGSGSYVNTNGSVFADGFYQFNGSYTNESSARVAIAPGSIDMVMDGSLSSIAGSSTTSILSSQTLSGALPVGSFEEFVFMGSMTGTNAKRILIDYAAGGTVFDSNLSGTPLNALTTPWELRIIRKQATGASHLSFATLTVGSTVIGPQRLSTNFSAGSFQTIQCKLITADAAGLTLDIARRIVAPVKNR